MDFIHTFVHGVRDIRSRTHQTGTGRAADAGPPVITIIEHKPGFWAAYGAQTVACGLLAAAGAYGIRYVAQQRIPGPLTAWDLLFVAFGVMVLLGALLAVYFVLRFRQMQRVFDSADARLEPTGTGAEELPASDSRERAYETDVEITEAALVAQHPNLGRFSDPSWVAVTGLLLLATALVQLFSGTYLAFTITGPYGQEELIFDRSHGGWLAFGIGQLLQFGPMGMLGVLVFRHHPWSVGLALILAVINLGLSLLTGHPFWISLAAVTVGLLALATFAFRRLHERIAAPDKDDALEAYYHNLMLALVRVMRADGRCDAAELRKISRLCNAVNLSAYEQDVVLRAANLSDPEPLDALMARFLEAARALELSAPGLGLLMCGYAVASADGHLAPEEAAALDELARAADVQPAQLVSLLTETQAGETLTPELARALLDVDADTPRADVDAAYLRLSSQLEQVSLAHLGQPLVDVVRGHRAALVRAYELLSEPASA